MHCSEIATQQNVYALYQMSAYICNEVNAVIFGWQTLSTSNIKQEYVHMWMYVQTDKLKVRVPATLLHYLTLNTFVCSFVNTNR